MGFWSEWQQEQLDQGWTYSDRNICVRCISEPFLKQVVAGSATDGVCSFCGSSADVAPLNVLLKSFAETIFQYYGHVDISQFWDDEIDTSNAIAALIGPTWDTADLVRQEFSEISDNEDVIQAIIDSLGDETWRERKRLGLDWYVISWERFCDTVKHRIRFFFESSDNSDPEEDVEEEYDPDFEDEIGRTIPVPRMLDELRDIIQSANLMKLLPADTKVFRVRPHKKGEACDTWQSLGSPPDANAVSNRMSAAGVSVFYGALDMATARAEVTAGMKARDPRVLTGASWTITRPVTVLDLTALPPPPSMFAASRRERDPLLFLSRFVKSITEPVIHDGREHIDYVPTQILTEYFRHRFRLSDRRRIQAILYPSAQRPGGASIAVFASQRDLDPAYRPKASLPILVMDQSSVKRQKRYGKRKRRPAAVPTIAP